MEAFSSSDRHASYLSTVNSVTTLSCLLQELWKKRTRTYFKNHRARNYRQREEVKQKISKRPLLVEVKGSGDQEVKQIKVSNKWGLKNVFPSSAAASEDEISVEVSIGHVNQLQSG